MPAPVQVTVKDLIGMWVTVQRDCSKGQHLFGANGEYRVWCFDSISDGKWSLRGADKIVVKPDPKKPDEEIITVLRLGGTLITHSSMCVTRMGAARNG